MSGCGRSELEELVLSRVKPTPLQLRILGRFYHMIKSRLEKCVAARGLRARVEAEGSYAKGTLTRDKWELDVFLLIEGVDGGWVKREGESLLLECLGDLPIEARYAEHPYITVRLAGMEADVVVAPLVSRPGEGGTGVERTPFHTRWVRRALEADECLADDIRLFKSFLKGIGAYGAETRVGGFSGLLAEILVIYHGGFRELLQAASKWRPGAYVDPLGVGSEGELRRRYPDSPLIVPDPVDPRRNAAAAVTLRRLGDLVLAAAAYLRRPCPLYFHPLSAEAPSYYEVDPGRVVAVALWGDYHGEPRDSLWGRLSRLASWLSRALAEGGFHVLRWEVETDESSEALIAFELESPQLPPLELVVGPPAWAVDRALSFASRRAAQRAPFIVASQGTLAALRPRRHLEAWKALAHALSRGGAPIPRRTRRWAVYKPGSAGARRAARLLESRTPRWPACLVPGCGGC